ncbi:MAG: SDR family oxidoreductase [Nocardioidaceae bacterium]
MSSFVTGATGFIGRHLVERLLARDDEPVNLLVRESSLGRLDLLRRRWGVGDQQDRIVPIVGDLGADLLGVDADWVAAHAGEIEHFFHLAALYDMTASDALNERMNVDGTHNALDLAGALGVRTFHHVSSIAVAGDFRGSFDETMFDAGQRLPSAYHRTKYASEQLVREQTTVPWRVYRPAIVVGDSRTGAMDKVDGPYYFFPLLKLMRDHLPRWAPVFGADLGDTNVVPVDWVAAAIDFLAHKPGLDGQAFHLVDPDPQPATEVINTLALAAGAPRFAVPVDRRVLGLLPLADAPARVWDSILGLPGTHTVLGQTIGRLGVPPEVLAHVSLPTRFAARQTERALTDSGLSCPPLESYAAALWAYWEQHLDPSTAHDKKLRRALEGRTVVITGASSGIGRATALKVAQAGGIPILVARGVDKLTQARDDIESAGGIAHVYPCDLSDMVAIDALAKQLVEDHVRIDVVVNNAGRSIRRSLRLSYDRFHDFERTMQLNYFGAIRLIMGLAPAMQAGGGGHVVNVSSIGVQTNPPRFSAYVASKAALDAWSRVVSSELIGDGITFTTIHMPLVRTPMIAPTKLYDAFPTITPAQAADLVMRAIKDEPHEINTTLGTAGEVLHALAPKAMFRVLHRAYKVFPDSAAARGDGDTEKATSEQVLLARLLKGVHW